VVWIDLGVPYPLAVLLSIVAATAVALTAERLVIRPMQARHASHGMLLLVLFAVLIVVRHTTAHSFGPQDHALPGPLPEGALILGNSLFILPQTFVVYAALAVVFLLTWWLMRHTWAGRSLRVAAIDPIGAQLIGIDLGRVRLLAFGIGGLIAASRRGRDEMYAGLTPGLVPVAGEPAPVVKVSTIPFAVQFTPPKGVLPGMIGTLFDEKAETRDVTATLVDLAARGFWRIEQPDPKGDFRIVRLAPPQGLVGYERLLYDALFGDGAPVVTSSELEGKSFGQSVQAIERELYAAVTGVGWFKGNPQTARGLRTTLGMVIVVAAFFIGVSSGAFLLAVPLGLVGGAIAITASWAPVRSALGSAVTSQALGFKQYLETAEADQIKFEEGQDIFSRYLPYAIAYGCADRWAKIFAELAARGVPMQQPTWYIGPGYGYGYGAAWGAGGFDSIIGTLDGFSASAASAMTAATAGSSGGSGFSGGGFGGGGGGGGGGSW